MKALIPAAGLGTRFLPITIAIPKEMLPVVDKPAIQYIVEEGLDSGADEVIVVRSRDKSTIEEHFSPHPELVAHLRALGKDDLADAVEHASSLPVSYVYQEKPLGLGHAVLCGAQKTGSDPFFVMLGDVIVPDNNMLPAMRALSEEHGGASVIAVMRVPEREVSRYGVISGDEVSPGVWRVNALVEKPPVAEAPSNLAIFGRYLLTPRVMELLAGARPSAAGEIQLTDTLDALLREEEMYALVIDPSDGFDVGTIDSWHDANAALFARRR